MLGHVGDGNFHQMILYNPDKPEEAAAVKQFVDDMMDKAVSMEGTVSVRFWQLNMMTESVLTVTQGEHGIGLGKKVSHLRELETGGDSSMTDKSFSIASLRNLALRQSES